MKSNRALLLTLMTIIGALMVSVVSYAQTSPASASNTVTTIGITGGTGRPITQDALGSSNLISVALSGSTEVSVADSTGFAVGDYVRVDDGTTVDFHTVAGVSAGTVTITPALATSFPAGGTTSVVEQAVYTTVPTWNPVIGSTTSIKPGNHFLVNLKGLTTSDDAFVEVITTNPNELVKNYTYLNRTIGVYVLCEAASCSSAPYKATPAGGSYDDALDSTGTDINITSDILTLQNARQQFVLTGGYVYALTVEGGALFTIDTDESGGNDSLSPTDQVGITAR